MELGTLLPTHATGDLLVEPDAVEDWARRAEANGFAGLWALTHPVKPSIYGTAFLDPLVALSHAAGVTEEIDLGTSVLLLPLRRTADVASCALSIQHLAGGRLTLGLGAGNNPKEFDVAGVPMEERGPRLSEGMAVLQALFDGEASFDGRFHSFEDVRIDPQVEAPRLVAGGGSVERDGERRIPKPILERILNADGWIASPSPHDLLEHDWGAIRDYAEEQGRDPGEIDRVGLQYIHVVEGDAETAEAEQRRVFDEYYGEQRGYDHAKHSCLVGTVDEITERLRGYEALGFDQVILGPAAHATEDLDRQMELLSDRLLPEF